MRLREVVRCCCGATIVMTAFTTARADDTSGEDAALADALPRIAATEPVDALDTFRLGDGFRLELLAAEPLVTDPVAMQYDENGLAYVVEMNDYPYTDTALDVAWQEQTSASIGRVRILEDRDGDGRFDTSTVFADGLSWPTGVVCWQGGVFVTATPDVWYLKDTDGDHRADIRRRVLTGFRKYNVQAVMNNPIWGLDNKMYAAGSSNGGEIRSGDIAADGTATSDAVRLGRNDFRIDPVSEAFEVISGGARFGNTFDDVGNRFICNIRNPVQHIVLPQRYLARNPQLAVQKAVHDAAVAGDAIAVVRASPPEPWRVVNAGRLAADTSRRSPRSEMTATGYVTSSSGITIYRGAAYPPEYYGNAFVCEVAGNLVMRYRLAADGPTFVATRVTAGGEFLASTDNWFRPVNFVNAPDGTLHVLDMYRETIEHPWSIPDDIKAHLDLRSGRDRGRIYRLAPAEYPAGHDITRQPRLGQASTEELVAELDNPNAWWRETAHRLIFERQDQDAVAPLRTLLRTNDNPLARVHALWSLAGLDALATDDLGVGLSDGSAQVREHAVRLAESRLGDSAKILDDVLALAADDDIRVRFQTALSLGQYDGPRQDDVTAALASIARRDADDPWLRTAVLSSLSGREADVLMALMFDEGFAASEAGADMTTALAEVVGARNVPGEIAVVLTAVQSVAKVPRVDIVVALGDGLRRAGKRLHLYAAGNGATADLLDGLFAEAARVAGDHEASVADRQRSLRLLGHGPLDDTQSLLGRLLDAREPQALQLTAIETLGGYADAQIAELLLEAYSRLTPTVRDEVVNVLLARGERIMPLLEAIEDGRVAASQVSVTRRALLARNRNEAIRDRAAAVFAADAPSPRSDVIARYQEALTLTAESPRGEKIFRRECITCHRLGGEGHDVGINLATVKNRTAAEILVHVLDPNREVSPNYLEYIVVTDDGRTRTGVIAAETATGITLRRAEGKQETILRANIEAIDSSGLSLMPEGLEKNITPAEMADLLAFLVAMPIESDGE